MKRMKHSKYKNTGLIFELLVRQVASDTMHNRDSKALHILKRHFSKNAELSKELKLYRSLHEEKFINERKAELFLDAVLKSRRQLNESQLRREKYNLVKEINAVLDTTEFFNARITSYKQHAAIYKLFEFNQSYSYQRRRSSTAKTSSTIALSLINQYINYMSAAPQWSSVNTGLRS